MIRSAQLLALLLTTLASGCFSGAADHLRLAEKYTQEKRYDDAIEEYRLHMETFQKVEIDEPWRNPSFYRLAIGDLFLLKDDVQRALEEYLLAEKEGIEAESISYRIREVARWYRERGQLDDAFELLSKHRERDPLLFNDLLDEIAREKTAKTLSAAR